MQQVYLGILCQSSLQILSSSVRLDGKRWWTAIFSLSRDAQLGFKSGLWLGHSRTVTELLWSHSFVILAVCLGSLSCWKVNLRPSLRSWALWRSSRISLYLAALSSLDCNQLSCPCSWKTPPQHDAATTMLHCWDCIGQVMSSAWFLHTYRLELRPKSSILVSFRPENLICHHLGVLQVFFSKLHAGFHVSCTEERLPSCHSAIKPRLVEGYAVMVDFYTFSHLSECISGAQPTVIFGSSLPLSPRLFSPDSSIWPDGSSRKGLVVPNVFHLRIMEATVLLGTLSAARIFFVTLARSVPCHNSVSELFRQILWPHDSHLLWHALWAVRSSLYRQVCGFPNQVQSV